MIPKNMYRLNEYRITEFADGRLWWDAYSGFGTHAGGQCYVYGNILLMGTKHNLEDGFLILEYFDKLKKLPLWNRTLYYCFTSSLLDVATGGHINQDRLQQLVYLPRKTSVSLDSVITDKLQTFRLRQYQISITPEGDVSWKSYGGMNRIVGGPVLIESDVLFIEPENYEDSQQSKREFLHALKLLPKWEQTTFWCRGLVLKPLLPQKEQTLHVPLQKKERSPQKEITPLRDFKPEYVKKIQLQMSGYYGECLEEVKIRWSKIGWLKRKKPPEIKNKLD